MDLCILHIDDKEFGIPMESVREVLIRPRVSPLPLSPQFLEGVTSFRGGTLPVFEVASFLTDTDPSSNSNRDRVVVCQDPSALVGLRVDLVDRMEYSSPVPEKETSITSGLNETDAKFLRLDQLLKHMTQHMKPSLT
ncbi:MAG: chemotaxis protein CheW [Verrucomicrobiota bacterium]